ncbi:MAG TPA: hypothetical protein VF032_03100 [Thermoleophilaceae bacterium]
MCHERWFRREQRDERFESELRDLMDRERERPEPPTPLAEHKPDADPVAERSPHEAPVAGSR